MDAAVGRACVAVHVAVNVFFLGQEPCERGTPCAPLDARLCQQTEAPARSAGIGDRPASVRLVHDPLEALATCVIAAWERRRVALGHQLLAVELEEIERVVVARHAAIERTGDGGKRQGPASTDPAVATPGAGVSPRERGREAAGAGRQIERDGAHGGAAEEIGWGGRDRISRRRRDGAIGEERGAVARNRVRGPGLQRDDAGEERRDGDLAKSGERHERTTASEPEGRCLRRRARRVPPRVTHDASRGPVARVLRGDPRRGREREAIPGPCSRGYGRGVPPRDFMESIARPA
jgi:hypothetical protein